MMQHATTKIDMESPDLTMPIATPNATSSNYVLFDKRATITAVLAKTYQEEKLGIAFLETPQGDVVLGKIQGRFEKESDLVSGLRVFEVNGVPIDSSQQALMLVRSAGVGELVSVVADGICVRATKRKRNDKAGIRLLNTGGGVKIAQVDIKGYFPSLRPGQLLVAVNGHAVKKNSEAIKYMNQAKDLSLVVVPQQPREDEEEASQTSSSPSLATTYTSSISSIESELELMEPIHFQMQDDDDDGDFGAAQ